MSHPYDALLLISFGGPEKRDDVLPFLENVLRGKNVPAERVQEVAEHYYLFEGVSPINAQNRSLLVSLVGELNRHGPPLPVYWGNRNWHPLLADVLEQMAEDGVRRALAFVTSAFGSYSGCRQYLEDISRAREAVGPRRRKSTSSACSTITRGSSSPWPTAWPRRWARFLPTAGRPPD